MTFSCPFIIIVKDYFVNQTIVAFPRFLGERFDFRERGIINTQLIGTGSCIPEFALTNAMLEQMVDTSDEWIVKRTGVRERRIARNTRTWELALGAAQNALADAGITAEELDLLLVSTCTPDTNTPNTASVLHKLGARQVGAMDINNACAGFDLRDLNIADSYIRSGKAKTVLVVSAASSTHPHRCIIDRSTCILFGDGAAAAVYRATEDAAVGIQSTFIAADGLGAEYLYMEALPVEDPFAPERTVDPEGALPERRRGGLRQFHRARGSAGNLIPLGSARAFRPRRSTGWCRIRPTCASWT